MDEYAQPRSEMSGSERRLGVLRPFAIRDFRLLWTGMTVSLVGDGIFIVAVAWQVYDLSNRPTALALVGLAWTVPMVAFLLLGGVIADRFDRRRVMILSDAIRALAVGGMGVLAISGALELWHLYALSALYGAGDALFPPAFGATIPDLVPEHLLVQANSVDGLVRPFAMQLVGPALGGVLVDAVGAGTVFLLDAGSFLFSMTVLLLMRPVPARPREGAPPGILADIREGLGFVRSHVWIWGTLVAAALFLLVWLGPFEVLLPFVVRNEIDGSARDLGLVFASAGLGSILAALVMAQRALPRKTITFMYGAFALSVSGPIVYGLADALWPMLVMGFAAGAGAAAGGIVWLTLLQRHVPATLLGRVTSLDWMISISLAPISFALTGPVAAMLGAPETLVGAGVLGVAITLSFLFLPGMRDLERGPGASVGAAED
jgi:DHA3 family tetracycline resistance protein-like MFS transporter